MAASTTWSKIGSAIFDAERNHRLRMRLTAGCAVVALIALGVYGYPYYRLELAERVASPLHSVLRSSGSLGIKLGLAGAGLYCILFLYAIRKRSKKLSKIGKTKHWLDFHIICGITAPILITYHSTFKFGGLAGISYWIMIAVALSGFVGRFIYSQIPRTLSAAEVSLKELEDEGLRLSGILERQNLLAREKIAPLFKLPTRQQVGAMPLINVFILMLALDLARPLRVAELRLACVSSASRWRTLFGFLPSSNSEVEGVISALRSQAWLSARIVFLERAHEIFHLWHVIHRPFSYSFAVLVLIHIAVVVLLGFY